MGSYFGKTKTNITRPSITGANMYRKISDFLKDWESEKESTRKIFGSLTDESLECRSYPDGRTIGRVAWHITSSVSEMGRMAGMEIINIDEKSGYPLCAGINSLYEKAASDLTSEVGKWNDEMLDEEITLYGENWTRGFTLQVLVKHQIHHRGQLTVMMRQAGLIVPGVYGPAKEEWAAYNMQPME
jgi:uncharacterized damage-inducible protein DinB